MKRSSTKLAPVSVQKIVLYPCLWGAYYQIRKNWLYCETASCNPDLTSTAGAQNVESSGRQKSAGVSSKYITPWAGEKDWARTCNSPPTAHSEVLPTASSGPASAPAPEGLHCGNKQPVPLPDALLGFLKMSQFFFLYSESPIASYLMHIQK